ncbi:MAG TPA: N-acetylmuramoyl-L-alanine amidase [Candidatus Acidoferrales bacterium]|nr:N-acetylmuramoyl-L-alanine amidase [Candidatus Acidoferrales bacterium]
MRKKVLLNITTFFLYFLVASFVTLFTALPAHAATILLDPGHSSIVSSVCNPSLSKGVYDDPYGIYDDDYPNCPEIKEVMDVANWLNQKLTADGYHVIMTKTAWDSPTFVSLWDRAQQANTNNVDLAVSIHDDHGQQWSNFAQVYDQRTNEYRVNKNGNKVTFAKVAGSAADSIANKSQQYAQIMAKERSKTEGHTVSPTQVNFAGRAPLAAGNITQVQLYAKVPWVYNEVGGIGIDLNKYEQGILNGIEKAVLPSGGGNGTGNSTACFILNQNNLPKDASLPAGCGSGGGNQSVVALGEKYINNPKYLYIWGGPSGGYQTTNPNGFDCSGFAQWIWYHGTNNKVVLARTTSDAWDNAAKYKLQKFLPSQISQIQPGDLLYFYGGEAPPAPRPGHVGVYTGDNKCGGPRCYMEFANSGQKGDYASLNTNGTGGAKFYGFLRPMVQ